MTDVWVNLILTAVLVVMTVPKLLTPAAPLSPGFFMLGLAAIWGLDLGENIAAAAGGDG